MSRAERLHGTLRPHERVHADVGWNVVPDIDFDRPFHEIAFATADELKRGGIIPANGQRISFRVSHSVWESRCAGRRYSIIGENNFMSKRKTKTPILTPMSSYRSCARLALSSL
jgi:hypothetical protein